MTVVTSYTNPDLDGVACALVYVRYLDTTATVAFAGALNVETSVVLSELGIDAPPKLDDVPALAAVILVDTHHVRQLPDGVRADWVRLIIDHHADGESAAFPNATVQNERVGAAATLIAERIIEGGVDVEPAYGALLACAITSNTLNFRAPSTVGRDREAHAWLSDRVRGRADLAALAALMSTARVGSLEVETLTVLLRDTKRFETPSGMLVISQVEAEGAGAIAEAQDLLGAMDELGKATVAELVLVSLVDLRTNETTLISTAEPVWRGLRDIHPAMETPYVGHLPYLVLRKTHLVPRCSAMTATEPAS